MLPKRRSDMTRRIPPTFLAGAGLTAQRTSPRSHAHDVPVVRELPSLPRGRGIPRATAPPPVPGACRPRRSRPALPPGPRVCLGADLVPSGPATTPVAVIGAGHVGASVAYALVLLGVTDCVVLYDR